MNLKENRRRIGEEEEGRAIGYFVSQGWELLDRNYRSPGGEIDLIFKQGKDWIVFVEVKYRSTSAFGPGQAAVHGQKQNRMIRTALRYIKEKRCAGLNFRFDVAAVTPQKIEHISNAFSAEGYTL